MRIKIPCCSKWLRVFLRTLSLCCSVGFVCCSLDLQRETGSLEIFVVNGGDVATEVTVVIEHAGTQSEIRDTLGGGIVVESVPLGRSSVWVTADGSPARVSNRLEITVFENARTQVGVVLLDNPDADPDGDGIASLNDNCPFNFDGSQQDGDHDGVGDVCDNCPARALPDQSNVDGDKFGDLCDPDLDGDGVLNVQDACPADPLGFVDQDGDAVCDNRDNCVAAANPEQSDCDADGTGDACDLDIDNDGVLNTADVCQFTFDPAQVDSDGDGVGDACAMDPGLCVRGVL